MPAPWSTVSTKPLGDYRVFRLRGDQKISPRTGLPHDFIVIDCVNWVNVIALTPSRELVMIEQYRHGSNTVELEVPGGIMDTTDISPIATGERELREETGYEGTGSELLGQVYSNPAIMSNTTFTVLIHDCELRHSLSLDPGEDITVRLMPLVEIPDLVRSGKIKHSLVVVALYHYHLRSTGEVAASLP